MPSQKRSNSSAGNVQFIHAQPKKDTSKKGADRKGRTMSTDADSIDADSPTQEVTVVQPLSIPTMGWPATWYQMKLFFNKQATPPRLNKKEIAHNKRVAAETAEAARVKAEADRRIAVRMESNAQLRSLSDQKPILTVVFIGVKGSAATTTTTANAASICADISKSTVLATDFNPAQGTLAASLGKDYGETATIRDIKTNRGTFTDFHSFIHGIRPTRYGVRTISANDIVSHTDHLDAESALEILDISATNTEYHFIDTANDITDPVCLAALEKADVFVFTAYVGIRRSLRLLSDGMETARRHGFETKVTNSIVVISGIPAGESLEDYRKFINRVDLQDNVKTNLEGKFKGPLLGVPYDEIIRRDEEVDLPALQWETYQAYLELDISILEQGLELQEIAAASSGGRHAPPISAPEHAPQER